MKTSNESISLISYRLHWLAYCLLLFTFGSSATTTNSNKHNIHILYSSENKLQSSIAQKISTRLNNSNQFNYIVYTTPLHSISPKAVNAELVVAIGSESIKYTNLSFIKKNILAIASNPNEYTPEQKEKTSKAILYMSQPYCRQIHFIKKINQKWSTISYLNNLAQPANHHAINQCAKDFDISTYKVDTMQRNLSRSVKKALSHSDLILALPDKNIYNGKSVKNILLTSYRSRKPVIGFSKNFTAAGALASIYSTTDQISQSAETLINNYYKSNNRFKTSTNYPETFDISINKQVFRALNLSIPDINRISEALTDKNTTLQGKSQ